MTRVGLVACGKDKLDRAAPARHLYVGDLFKKASAYAERHYDHWYILSAKHGLVNPDQVIEPYDLSLNDLKAQERSEWAGRVLRQIEELSISNPQYFLHAGKLYSSGLAAALNGSRPLEGLGIGQQLAWYIRHA